MRPRPRSTSEARGLARGLLLLITAALLGGCQKEPGTFYRCTCTVLTDFDDASKRDIRVCAPSVNRADVLARSCAREGAPAPVSECACRAEVLPEACTTGECRAAAR
ncbi:MAG: hypothetical protein U0359_39285 [Byssovorax sp.]